jgi:hypothetical protein
MFKISLRISKAKKKHFENEQKKRKEIKKKRLARCLTLNKLITSEFEGKHKRV